MKKVTGVLLSFLAFHVNCFAGPITSRAEDSIKITIDSLTNVSGNGAIEACGTAIQKDGVRPLLVTIKHSESYYSVLTAPNDKWCVVFKRWTFGGEIDVSATSLLAPDTMHFQSVEIPNVLAK